MTGGSSRALQFPELVLRRTGVKAVLAEDALYCVVKGPVLLEHLDTYKKSILAKNNYGYVIIFGSNLKSKVHKVERNTDAFTFDFKTLDF